MFGADPCQAALSTTHQPVVRGCNNTRQHNRYTPPTMLSTECGCCCCCSCATASAAAVLPPPQMTPEYACTPPVCLQQQHSPLLCLQVQTAPQQRVCLHSLSMLAAAASMLALSQYACCRAGASTLCSKTQTGWGDHPLHFRAHLGCCCYCCCCSAPCSGCFSSSTRSPSFTQLIMAPVASAVLLN